MKREISIGITILVISLLTLSCGKTYTRYMPDTDLPRMVYMENDVQNLETVGGRLNDKPVYVEVTTRKGERDTGKLMRIDEDDLVISLGYYYSREGESVVKVDVEKLIPKGEILILKIF
jgi:hypothetical protein